MNCLCYLPDDGPEYERIGIADWPPVNPATYTRHDGFKLIRGASFASAACQQLLGSFGSRGRLSEAQIQQKRMGNQMGYKMDGG